MASGRSGLAPSAGARGRLAGQSLAVHHDVERTGVRWSSRARSQPSDHATAVGGSRHRLQLTRFYPSVAGRACIRWGTCGDRQVTQPRIGEIRIGAPACAGKRCGVRVLLVSLFHPEIVRGGAQQVCYELFQGLKERDDVEVSLLAAIDESQPALYKSGARITGFDGRPGEFLFLSREYDYWWHKTSNVLLLESYAEFLQLLDPDVVHFHHFLLLGIDLITLTRRTLPKARIVLTLHEFMAICAADGQMLRKTDGSLCSRASAVRCHQCFPDSAPEKFFMREMWMKKHLECVDVLTTPSRYMIRHYTDWGIDPSRIVHVPNGQRNYANGMAMQEENRPRNRFGFFGQLVDNKGVWVVLQAVEHLRAEGF